MILCGNFIRTKIGCATAFTTLETHLRILSNLAPYAAMNFVRRGMGYEDYCRNMKVVRKIEPEEVVEILERIRERLE